MATAPSRTLRSPTGAPPMNGGERVPAVGAMVAPPTGARSRRLARIVSGTARGCGRTRGGAGEPCVVASAPDQLTLKRHRDLVGRENRPYARWALLTLLGLLCLLGLLNAFGQRPQTQTAFANGAELEVYSPERLRSGLFFMSRFTIRAERELESATLLLDPGWVEGITLNTLVPSPVGEANRDGKIVFDLGHVRAGTEHVFFLHFQVNPTEVGRRPQDVALLDGETPLLHIDRTVTIYP